jgi:hypothetical protein
MLERDVDKRMQLMEFLERDYYKYDDETFEKIVSTYIEQEKKA